MNSPVDRIYEYLKLKGITAYEFERKCEIANAYLSRQKRGTGHLGSEILVKILKKYTDIEPVWLLLGEGSMLKSEETAAKREIGMNTQLNTQLNTQNEKTKNMPHKSGQPIEESELLKLQNQVILSLRDQIEAMKAANADKQRIIALQDEKLNSGKSRIK